MYEYLPTPAVAIELEQVEKNIIKMVEDAKKYGIGHRPHIKPHKSSYFAQKQLELGAIGVTCAKLGEAEVMAEHGIKDILVAYPLIGQDKMIRVEKLLDKTVLTTIVNSEIGAKQLSDAGVKKGVRIRTLIEVDGGINRGGLKPGNDTLEFAKKISGLDGIEIVGIMYYGGTIYGESTLEGFDKKTSEEREHLLSTANLLKEAGFKMEVLSGGNSFSSKRSHLLEGITEVRAGHYIFNDCGQLTTGFATPEECALRVVATVVSVTDDYHAIIDAGSKSLTTDLCGHRKGYGYVIGREDICICKLNEEHGFIESNEKLNLQVGDKIAIIPNHACVVANLVEEVYGIRDGKLERMIAIEARGKNQ